MAMIYSFIRIMLVLGIFLGSHAFTQDIPIDEPHLIPFPGIQLGLGYYSLVPTQNLILDGSVTGWTSQDVMTGAVMELNFELLRYRWGDIFFPRSKFDIFSSLGFSRTNQLGSIQLPPSFPTSYEVNHTVLSDFSMNALMKEAYLGHTFSYRYSPRSNIHFNLGTGLTHLSLYENTGGDRIFEASGLALHFGMGWKITLFGRPGERIRIGADLGYSIRNFDLSSQDENLRSANGTAQAVSPIQSISFNSPELKISLEFGEALFAANTPYRDPYRLGLVHLSAGVGLLNYRPGVNIQFDSTGTSISIPAPAKISQNYDLQIFSYNWPFHFIKQANIDLLSGIGFRYWKTSQITTLPSNWSKNFSDGSTEYANMGFAPKIFDIYLKHELIYPLGPKLYAKVNAGSGFATMTLYENQIDQQLIDGSSLTWQTGVGLGYTTRGDGSSQVTFGFNIHYYNQSFDFDFSESDLSPVTSGELVPISHLDLSQTMFSIDIGLIFGGRSNAAQKAHRAFQKKHYTEALSTLEDLLSLYPNHHNKASVIIQKAMIKDSLVTLYYRDVNTILNQGKLESAYSLIQHGDTPPGVDIEQAVVDMKVNITDQALMRAGHALEGLDYLEAERLILLALKSDPTSIEVAKTLLARSYIIRATILYQSGVFRRSLYWLKQAEGLTERYNLLIVDLRQKIGDGRLDDANEAILKEDRQMVYAAMQDAKDLNPILGDLVNEHLSDLEVAMAHIEKQKLGPMKRMALDNLLEDVQDLDPDNFVPKLGMRASLIAHYVGPPIRKFNEGDYELWVYERSEDVELWLYLRDGLIEKIEYQED